MDDFIVMAMSPVILIALTSTAEILQCIVVSPAPPLPRWRKSSPRTNNQNACKHLWWWTPCASECPRRSLCGHVKSLTLLRGIQESECGFLLRFLMHRQAQTFTELICGTFSRTQRINTCHSIAEAHAYARSVSSRRLRRYVQNPCLASSGKTSMKFGWLWKR